jgi:hypothetical protein
MYKELKCQIPQSMNPALFEAYRKSPKYNPRSKKPLPTHCWVCPRHPYSEGGTLLSVLMKCSHTCDFCNSAIDASYTPLLLLPQIRRICEDCYDQHVPPEQVFLY